jgi:hypothetical protein
MKGMIYLPISRLSRAPWIAPMHLEQAITLLEAWRWLGASVTWIETRKLRQEARVFWVWRWLLPRHLD